MSQSINTNEAAPDWYRGSFFALTHPRYAPADASFQLEMHLAPGCPYSSASFPSLPELLLDQYPELKKHACSNDKSASFAYELKDTELAHVLEHVIAEELALTGIPRRLIEGKTGWRKSEARRGPYRILIRAQVTQTNFETALRAAVHALEAACSADSSQ